MMGFGMLGFGMLFMLLFWVLIIGGGAWLVVMLVRGSQGQPMPRLGAPGAPAGQTPLEILNTRYAKGEITKQQLEEMKRDIGA